MKNLKFVSHVGKWLTISNVLVLSQVCLLLELVVILSSAIQLILLDLLLFIVRRDISGPFFLGNLWVLLLLWSIWLHINICALGFVTLWIIHISNILLIADRVVYAHVWFESNGREAVCVSVVSILWTIVVRVPSVARPSVIPILVWWSDSANVWVHVVSNMLLVLLPLILKLLCHLFPEYCHVLLYSLLYFLLNEKSNSLPHVVWDLLKLSIILTIENISFEILGIQWFIHIWFSSWMVTHLFF